VTTRRCPTCKKPFSEAESNALPFCSERCRQVDLGRWLDEDFGLPYESAESDDEPFDDEPFDDEPFDAQS